MCSLAVFFASCALGKEREHVIAMRPQACSSQGEDPASCPRCVVGLAIVLVFLGLGWVAGSQGVAGVVVGTALILLICLVVKLRRLQ